MRKIKFLSILLLLAFTLNINFIPVNGSCVNSGKKLKCFHESVNNITLTNNEIRHIELMGCKDTHLKKLEKSKWGPIEYVQIQCNLNILSKDAIQDLHNLRTLDLSNNKISQFPLSFFHEKPPIIELNFAYNRLHFHSGQSLTTDTFYGLDKLEKLDVSHNEIFTILPAVFDIPTLKHLNLANNFLDDRIPLNFFRELPNLESLDLSYNRFKNWTMAWVIFNNLNRLQNLNLSGNKFSQLSWKVFDSLKSLSYLRLRDCNLNNMVQGFLNELINLEYLDLSYNKISTIPKNFFKENVQLKYLFLSGNNLQTMNEDTFSSLPNLLMLKLDSCKIKEISYNLLRNNVNLITLDLSKNKIQAISSAVFKISPHLKFLYLTGNEMRTLPTLDSSVQIWDITLDSNNLNSLPIKNLQHLRKLYVGNNALISFPDGLFAQTKHLTHLDISYNNFLQLPDDFEQLSGLKYLDISGNNFKEFPSLPFKRLDILKMRDFKISENTITNLAVSVLKQIKSVSVLDISKNKFIDLSKRMFANLPKLKVLNVSENEIQYVLQSLTNFRLEILDLSNNRLNAFPGYFLRPGTLKELYLRNNKIPYLELDSLEKVDSLILLDVRDNRLAFIEDMFFEKVPNLLRFEVVGNPWDCVCYEVLQKNFEKRGILFDIGNRFNGDLPYCVIGADSCEYRKSEIDEYFSIWTNYQ